jgi:twinkle protein
VSRKEQDEVLTTDSIFGGAKATQEADNVLLLQEEKSPSSFFKKKYIQVSFSSSFLKKRLCAIL